MLLKQLFFVMGKKQDINQASLNKFVIIHPSLFQNIRNYHICTI